MDKIPKELLQQALGFIDDDDERDALIEPDSEEKREVYDLREDYEYNV